MHGQVVLSGGSFDTAGAFARVQYAWKASTVGASASGDMTSRYLNPVVPQNYTNRGTTGDFAARYERDLTAKDRIGLIVRHDLSRFQIPNEQIQQGAGQRQDGGNFETMGIASYQHVFSSDLLGSLRAMVRDNANDLTSNPQSTPVIAFLHNHFRETYFNGALSLHHGNHDFKAGFESDNTFLQESFNDRITDRTRFDPGTPLTFVFPGSIPSEGRRPELDQAAYIQDSIRSRNWTFSAGLRLDHYQLLVNQNALSPRLSAARFFPASGLVVHVSYDHVFQTPEAENILLASSPQVVSLNPSVLRLPVEPSRGNYYEIGVTKAVLGQLRLDANYYRRYSNNYADDDQLLSTAVAFPIAFTLWRHGNPTVFVAAIVALALLGGWAAGIAGVSSRSAYRLRNKAGAESFARAWDAALSLCATRLAAIAFDRALHGRSDRFYRDGELVMERKMPSDYLLTWLLSRLDPLQFGSPNARALVAATGNPRERSRQSLPELVASLTDDDCATESGDYLDERLGEVS